MVAALASKRERTGSSESFSKHRHATRHKYANFKCILFVMYYVEDILRNSNHEIPIAQTENSTVDNLRSRGY